MTVRISVAVKDGVFTASSADFPKVAYSSPEEHEAVRSLRCHILRSELQQAETGSASPWLREVMPLVSRKNEG